ncbi:MAG: hypothetical protein QOF28_1425, partial [Actinomycetota bacterium]|nr:hypothetical protein [Actinomycetota bacterium]
ADDASNANDRSDNGSGKRSDNGSDKMVWDRI